MSRRKQSRGPCTFCGKELTKSGLNRHWQYCEKRQETIKTATANNTTNPQRLYHVQIEAERQPYFWLHLELNETALLADLDHYLRTIWLECCDHVSEFRVENLWGREISMEQPVEQLLQPNITLKHTYDFGTPSVSVIKLVDMREGQPLSKYPIYLMARNQMPQERCHVCEAEWAGWFCMECIILHNTITLLCKKHAETHPHKDYGSPIPLVNSPRLGKCGYNGPDEPPY